ncbi:MAG TPA: hypothetical protein P5258_05550, partial [Candidatus Saccharicenans sp.]|nr:hypothetical protein [Candidatus Saccharicenans sp.]
QKLEAQGEKPVEGVQIFTPTPMTRSTCMYYTGIDPETGKSVYVPRSFEEKKEQKRLLLSDLKPEKAAQGHYRPRPEKARNGSRKPGRHNKGEGKDKLKNQSGDKKVNKKKPGW